MPTHNHASVHRTSPAPFHRRGRSHWVPAFAGMTAVGSGNVVVRELGKKVTCHAREGAIPAPLPPAGEGGAQRRVRAGFWFATASFTRPSDRKSTRLNSSH